MKHYLLAATLLFILSCSNNLPDNDLKKGKLNGKIKTIMCSVSFYDSTKATPFIGTLVNKTIREFDESGNEIKFTFVNQDDKVETIRTTTYNEKKQKTTATEKDEEGNPIFTINYKYDKQNNITEIVSTDLTSNQKTKQITTYDKNNNPILIKDFSEGDILNYRVESRFNDKNLMTEESIYLADGNLDYRAVHTYDDKGREISVLAFDKNKTKIWEFKYDYKLFDKDGNCLLKYQYRDGRPIRVEQYQIEYYP